jgi:hypothetical protein
MEIKRILRIFHKYELTLLIKCTQKKLFLKHVNLGLFVFSSQNASCLEILFVGAICYYGKLLFLLYDITGFGKNIVDLYETPT